MTTTEKVLLGLAAVNAAGTVIEYIGKALGRPWLEELGRKLEALPGDLPKLWGEKK